jgi:HK97 family phage major capsid protein
MAVRDNKEETSNMEIQNTNETSADIAEVRNAIEEIDRKVALLAEVRETSSSNPVSFRSYGEYVKAVATGEKEGLDLHRAFNDAVDGGVLADSILKNAWVSDSVRILNAGRPTFNVFSSAALPADGMTLEYPVLDTDTTIINEQAAEADELTFGKITLTSATAPIKTYGGYTDMSRQVIERSSVAYVDTTFRAMIAQYAKKTNAVVKASLVSNAGNFNTATVAAWDASAVIEAIADSAMKVNEDTGLPIQFILASGDVFKSLAKVTDDSGRPILSNSGATVNTFGAINPVGMTGTILGLPIVVDPSLPAGAMYVGNAAALTTYESAGAPFRLNDEDITNLTQKFSVYGYLAVAAPDTKALVLVGNPND